jgi:hypothetical protein
VSAKRQAGSNHARLCADSLTPTWTFAPDGAILKAEQTGHCLPAAAPTSQPSTSGEFQREWRRNCPTDDEKYRYLKLCTPEKLASIFKVEVSSAILGDILQVPARCMLRDGARARCW